MNNLRGFWKDGNSTLPIRPARPSKQEIWQAQKKARKKFKKRGRNRIASPTSDRFYLSEDWRKLRYLALRNTDGKCQCCGASAKDGVRIHVDHIKPRSRFPHLQLRLDNLQVLCDDCNIGKGAWDETDWRGNCEQTD
jgi:5-methylcytosine-specific restriction endonuclease McrA